LSPFQRFALKALALGAPLALATAVYLVRDPFRVIQRYDFGNYYDKFAPVEINRDYASFQIFTAQYPEAKYDSFIFGSSRSFPFHCDAWRPFIGGASARPFHYPAASENLIGIAKKIQYLDAHGVTLAHVLIEASYSTLGDVTLRTDPTHRLPYEISNEGWFEFQAADFTAFFSDFYFVKYTDFALTGAVRPYARSALGIHVGDVRIDPPTNDYFFESYERELRAGEDAYYERRSARFPPVPSGAIPCREPWVGDAQLAVLEMIHAVFERQRTDYRIVIPPYVDEVCLSRADLEKLQTVFGAENVFDYSGENDIARDRHNFYDETHVRPFVADRIIREIYRAR